MTYRDALLLLLYVGGTKWCMLRVENGDGEQLCNLINGWGGVLLLVSHSMVAAGAFLDAKSEVL